MGRMHDGFRNTMTTTLAAGLLAAGAFAAPAANETADAEVVAIRAAMIHVGDGRVIENGTILIEDGEIAAIGTDVSVPAGATVIEAPRGGSVTPGLIDAHARVESEDLIALHEAYLKPGASGADHGPLDGLLGEAALHAGHMDCDLALLHQNVVPGNACPSCGFEGGDLCGGAHGGANAHAHRDAASMEAAALASGVLSGVSETEAAAEVVPHTRVLDTLNLRSHDFERLARGGVTTVFAAPDTAAVIGPRGAIVKTAGPVRKRVVSEADAAQATLGTDSFRVGGGNGEPWGAYVTNRTRRPNSRMGVVWVFRKAFVDAAKAAEGIEPTGVSVPEAPALEALNRIRAGEVGLRVQARTATDIEVAGELCEEFGLDYTLVEATEAYRFAEELAAERVPVVFGPIYMEASPMRRWSGEVEENRLSTLKTLLDAGVPTALTAQDLRGEDGLARQAMYAMRAGVSLEDALKAVTSTPAKILGIDRTHGTLEPGKAGDVVIWSGEPFAATSGIETVVVGGRVVGSRD